MDIDYETLSKEVEAISPAVTRELEKRVEQYLDKCGLLYKHFSRIKSSKSVCKKIQSKLEEKGEGYKIQDLVGVRVVVYFKEDIALCERLIEKYFAVLDVSRTAEDMEHFGPQRINYVCKLPEDTVPLFSNSLWKYPIDKSFEVQIRTIFSEGWHEIEHDFRYKCKKEWENNSDLSRTLNGIFATLDSCDWAIASLLDQVAYRHYKANEWIPMLKNVFKMRIVDCDGMEDLSEYFHEHKDVAKQYFRLERQDFLIELCKIKSIPLTLKNIVYLANILQIHDRGIDEITPELLKTLVLSSIQDNMTE